MVLDVDTELHRSGVCFIAGQKVSDMDSNSVVYSYGITDMLQSKCIWPVVIFLHFSSNYIMT